MSRRLAPFLIKLWKMVSECSAEVGAWNAEGSEFVMKHSAMSASLVQFNLGHPQLFHRQLHYFYFKPRTDALKDQYTFSHPSFLRDMPDLVNDIVRQPKNKKKAAVVSEEEEEEEETAPVSRKRAAPPPPPHHQPSEDTKRFEMMQAQIRYLEDQLMSLRSQMPPAQVVELQAMPVIQEDSHIGHVTTEKMMQEFDVIATENLDRFMNSSMDFDDPTLCDVFPEKNLFIQAWGVVARQLDAPEDTSLQSFKDLLNERPHPNTLPPVSECPVVKSMMATLTKHIAVEADSSVSEQDVMNAARQLYVVYYGVISK